MRIILTLVGTSLLTNVAKAERVLVNQYSNSRLDEIPANIRSGFVALLDDVSFQGRTLQEAKAKSAELQSLAALYRQGKQTPAQDIHFLVHTDTYIGQLCSSRLQEFFSGLGWQHVQTLLVPQLAVRSKEAFQEGIKWLVNWCEEVLPLYKAQKYEIVFNLTGGFKSLQGYLNVIGMFYADKVVYIFENSDQLLEIPRLPIRLDSEFIEKAAPSFLLANYTCCAKDVVNDLPAIYLDEQDGLCTLSAVGTLMWSRYKRTILSRELVELPYLVYEDAFKRDFRYGDRDPVKLQETLVKVSCLMAGSEGNTARLKADGGLQYENYLNKSFNGEPIGHFRITQETRASCVAKNGKLYLRRFGPHDYVNKNP